VLSVETVNKANHVLIASGVPVGSLALLMAYSY
jgi:hypothetical protein